MCAYVSVCACLSNYTSSVLSSLLNYILFVPLGAEGPVNCLELGTASPPRVLRQDFIQHTANPNAGTWMMRSRPLIAAALFTEHSTTDKPIEIAAAHSLWGGIKSVCSRLISGLDAGGINKLWEEGRLDSLTHSLLSSYSLTHSLSHSPLTLLINSTALRQICYWNSCWLPLFLHEWYEIRKGCK